jgi:hypothetical protein
MMTSLRASARRKPRRLNGSGQAVFPGLEPVDFSQHHSNREMNFGTLYVALSDIGMSAVGGGKGSASP